MKYTVIVKNANTGEIIEEFTEIATKLKAEMVLNAIIGRKKHLTGSIEEIPEITASPATPEENELSDDANMVSAEDLEAAAAIYDDIKSEVSATIWDRVILSLQWGAKRIEKLTKERRSLRYEIGEVRTEREKSKKALFQIRADMDSNKISLIDQRDHALKEIERWREKTNDFAEMAEENRQERDAARKDATNISDINNINVEELETARKEIDRFKNQPFAGLLKSTMEENKDLKEQQTAIVEQAAADSRNAAADLKEARESLNALKKAISTAITELSDGETDSPASTDSPVKLIRMLQQEIRNNIENHIQEFKTVKAFRADAQGIYKDLLNALDRLAAAASSRESTQGDPCTLIAVQGELRAATVNARTVIKEAKEKL